MPETSSIHVFLSRAGGETLHLHNLLMTFGMLKKKGETRETARFRTSSTTTHSGSQFDPPNSKTPSMHLSLRK